MHRTIRSNNIVCAEKFNNFHIALPPQYSHYRCHAEVPGAVRLGHRLPARHHDRGGGAARARAGGQGRALHVSPRHARRRGLRARGLRRGGSRVTCRQSGT